MKENNMWLEDVFVSGECIGLRGNEENAGKIHHTIIKLEHIKVA